MSLFVRFDVGVFEVVPPPDELPPLEPPTSRRHGRPVAEVLKTIEPSARLRSSRKM